ncbi:MAG: adenosylcobalamin-dependent ribonucleoside-diphosphate reductase, partial [Chitinophagaceae bacterium]|nr:adenosylcobalamin-dependent ribonucleoside-diphosphate reductase [Chitinophagaceae bacterium]
MKTSKESKYSQVYSNEEAFEESLKYFKGDDLAARVWINKYALKDSEGRLYEKSPFDMHKRIAEEISRIEAKYPNALSYDEVYDLIKDFKYIIPQGSPMTGIGNPFQVASLSNCFVIGNKGESDSYGGIMKIDQEQVQLMKRRGGVGHDLSHIRPKGSSVKNSALTSTGLVPFMERFSNSTREVAQDGRRGALMLSVSINHPDAEDFINAKLEQGKITGANISVRIDDTFMKAVKENNEYTQKYPIFSETPKFSKNIQARELWNKIVHNAWKSAEPGILFWDTIIKESLPDCYSDLGYKTISTNPCGEIPLCPYDSCRLLAINLFSYVINPFTKEASFDFELFKQHVAFAQRMMDDIIDLELEKVDDILQKIEEDPEDVEIKRVEKNLWLEIKNKAQEGRRTGVGITAEGDMLAALGRRYGSPEGNDWSVKIHQTLALSAYRASGTMAQERGAFLIYNAQREEKNPFVLRLKEADPQLFEDMQKYGRRNIALLTIAPTGSTSLMSQTTSGIEPVFMPVYKRRRKVNPNDKNVRVDFIDEVGDSWEEYTVFHHKFKQWMEVNQYDTTINYSNEEINDLIEKSPYYKATSNDVDWLSKVKMQGAIQKWVDHSISVTINIPNEASEELVNQLYMTAWEEGCKGVTVYRDGSRSGVLISNETKPEKSEEETPNQTKTTFHFPTKRPQTLKAD